MSNTNRVEKTYLGDSVYVEFGNEMFKLYTDNGLGPSNVIYMEPGVYAAFRIFADEKLGVCDQNATRISAKESKS